MLGMIHICRIFYYKICIVSTYPVYKFNHFISKLTIYNNSLLVFILKVLFLKNFSSQRKCTRYDKRGVGLIKRSQEILFGITSELLLIIYIFITNIIIILLFHYC